MGKFPRDEIPDLDGDLVPFPQRSQCQGHGARVCHDPQ